MKTLVKLFCAAVLICLTGCMSEGLSEASGKASAEQPQGTAGPDPAQQTSAEQEKHEANSLSLAIGGTPVKISWEDNESVTALRELVKEEPITVQMSMYGGFEQVGSLWTSLPRNDVQTVTQAGDVVLYAGNQIVLFYGSNSWAYTRLGKITDQTADEMKALLGNGDVTVTLSLE